MRQDLRVATAGRTGATMFLVLILMVIMMIFAAFAIDVGRVQLAHLKLQTSADLAARAGAEALARGVGDIDNLQSFEQAIRDETDMLMQMNELFGAPVTFDANTQVSFGISTPDATVTGPPNGNGQGNGKAKMKFFVNPNGKLDFTSNSIKVEPNLNQFPLFFGGFLGRRTLNLPSRATAQVQDRDIILVIDRSTSMLEHDAGSIPFMDFDPNLLMLEDALYQSGDSFYSDDDDESAHTEFEYNSDGTLELSRIQALKLAILRFRQIIDSTPGIEQLGLTSYSASADTPAEANSPVGVVDIENGLSQAVFSQIVGNGVTRADSTENYASSLEGSTTGYDDFDFNYLSLRWQSTTAITDGIERGVDNMFNSAARRAHATPIIILMTDGIHNTDLAHNAPSPKAAVENAMASYPQLKFYTITFGSSANQTAMEEIADIGNGQHLHAADAEELVEAFRELATSAGVTIIE